MSEGVRTLIERLVSVDARNPTVTSVFLLWWQERIVYVGRATYGLFCDGTPSHYHGPDSAAGVQAKLFDRVSLIPCKDEMLGAVVRAFVKLLKPKYNRATKRHPLDEQDRAVLTLLGFDRSLLG
jgi:hypothetical protein